MKGRMSSDDYFRGIVGLYHESRKSKFDHAQIERGRSKSISSDLEDLTALFIAKNNPRRCTYYTDQPMKFLGFKNRKYPDIAIKNSDDVFENLVDMKTDMGWSRNRLHSFCEEWDGIVEGIKGAETELNRGSDKKIQKGIFSKSVKFHVAVITRVNSGKHIDSDLKRVNKMKNVRLYFFSDLFHPNEYHFSVDEAMERIRVDEDEVRRFLSNVAPA